MDEGAAGVLLLVVIASLTAIVSHRQYPVAFWRACWMGATVASVAWVITVSVIQAIWGKPDALILVAFIFAWFWSFVTAYLMGKIMQFLLGRPSGQA
jgi:hypothetical protein